MLSIDRLSLSTNQANDYLTVPASPSSSEPSAISSATNICLSKKLLPRPMYPRSLSPLTLPQSTASKTWSFSELYDELLRQDCFTHPQHSEQKKSLHKYQQTIGKIHPGYLYFFYFDACKRPFATHFFNCEQDLFLEPGYAASMERAFAYLASNLYTPLTPEFVITLHDLAIDGVWHKEIIDKTITLCESERGLYSNLHNYGYDFQITDASADALTELIDLERTTFTKAGQDLIHLPEYFFQCKDTAERPGVYQMFSLFTKEGSRPLAILQQTLAADIAAYHYRLATLSTNDFANYQAYQEAQLEIIAAFCKRLSMRHYFKEANKRTIIFLLLNKCLLANDLPPCILFNPLAFYGYRTNRELASCIRVGQAIAEHLSNRFPRSLKPLATLLHTRERVAAYILLNCAIERGLPKITDEALNTYLDKDGPPVLSQIPLELLSEALTLCKIAIVNKDLCLGKRPVYI